MSCLYTFVYLCVFHQGLFEGSRLSWKCSLTLILCFVFLIFIFVRFSHLDLLAFLLLVSLYLLSILKSWYEFKTVVLIFEFGIFLIVIVPCHSMSKKLLSIYSISLCITYIANHLTKRLFENNNEIIRISLNFTFLLLNYELFGN